MILARRRDEVTRTEEALRRLPYWDDLGRVLAPSLHQLAALLKERDLVLVRRFRLILGEHLVLDRGLDHVALEWGLFTGPCAERRAHAVNGRISAQFAKL